VRLQGGFRAYAPVLQPACLWLACVLLATAGCAGAPVFSPGPGIAGFGSIWKLGPGAAAPGGVYSSVVYPNDASPGTAFDIPYDPGSIEIAGWVETSRASGNLAGLIPGLFSTEMLGVKASDYGTVLRELCDSRQLDGLLNTVVDTRLLVLNLYVIKFQSVRTVVGGVGYRFRETPPAEAETVLSGQVPR